MQNTYPFVLLFQKDSAHTIVSPFISQLIFYKKTIFLSLKNLNLILTLLQKRRTRVNLTIRIQIDTKHLLSPFESILSPNTKNKTPITQNQKPCRFCYKVQKMLANEI